MSKLCKLQHLRLKDCCFSGVHIKWPSCSACHHDRYICSRFLRRLGSAHHACCPFKGATSSMPQLSGGGGCFPVMQVWKR